VTAADLDPDTVVVETAAATVSPGAAERNVSVGERLFELATATRAQLSQLPPAAPVLSEEVLSWVWAAVDASTAANTKAAYRSDWARFTAWCTAGGHQPLPAHPLTVAAYLTEAAAEETGPGRWLYAPATLTRWCSSINQFHTAAHQDPPGRDEIVRRALSGIRRLRTRPPARRAPLLLDDLRTLLGSLEREVAGWPGGVAARRDATLLLLGFATAARRSELAALTVGDITAHRVDGLHIRLRKSKNDQEGRGAVKAVLYGRDPATCPPCAYTRWRLLLNAADRAIDGRQRRLVLRELHRQVRDAGVDGHVCRVDLPEPADPGRALFPRVQKTGFIGDTAMGGPAVNQIIARRAAAGYTTGQIAKLGGHSLRAGFVTEAFRQGADAHGIKRQTGHRNPAILEVYAREHAPLIGNAVTKLGL